MSNKLRVSFTEDFHYLAALIQHLGAHEKWNSRTPRNIASSIGLDKEAVERVLMEYPSFFRKSSNVSSQNEPLYSLHLRYARRRKNVDTQAREAPPVSSSELTMLMDLLTKMINMEKENKRLDTERRQNAWKMWTTIGASGISAIAALIAVFVK